MPGPDPLDEAARDFGRKMANLLNRTVAGAVSIAALIDHRNGSCRVGQGLSTNSLAVTPIPLTTGAKPPMVWLIAQHRLTWDAEDLYLAAVASAYRVYADADCFEPLLRFEYVRDNEHHTEAHIHVHADWISDAPLPGTSPPRKLHLPVGGRRFRPSLEDVIEFLVREGFADGKPGWEQAVQDHRDDWFAIQLKAAVRRHPGRAVEQLREMGAI